MPVPFKVKAIYEYKSDEPDDLQFSLGQIITVINEEDADWYTGEYEGASGKVEGIFPRNFVEKYEPAIPSRPARSTQKSAQPASAPAPVPASGPSRQDAVPTQASQPVTETRVEQSAQARSTASATEDVGRSTVDSRPSDVKPSVTKQPPPVAEKPASSSFKDRIAAFNKSAAPPIAPFKPGGSSGTSFIKKPFVAPPPSRNAYVPPPTQTQPPAKVYRREEDPEMTREDDEDAATPAEPPRNESITSEEQPKPTSLKDRIALLQQQQMEQAQRAAEKRKPKKPPPPPRHADSADNDLEELETTEAPLAHQKSVEAAGKSVLNDERREGSDDEEEAGTPEHEVANPTVVPPPPRELVSDTNDADDSGAADTEDAHETSTEEDQRKSKTVRLPPLAVTDSSRAVQNEEQQEATGEEAENEGTEEEEEDPEIRRKRELRERMAKMSGGMGMMGMFGPPGGVPAPPKKSKPQKAEKPPPEPYDEDVVKAPPVPIMALPGMSTRSQQVERGEEEETASPTPMESTLRTGGVDEDYISHQPARTATDRSAPTSPYERAAPPPPPPRELRAPPPAPPSTDRTPQSPPGRSILPPPPPPPTRDETMDEADFSQLQTSARSSMENKPIRQPSMKKDTSTMPSGAPPPAPARSVTSDSMTSTHSAHDKRMSRPPPPTPASAVAQQTRAPPPPPPVQPPNRNTTGGSNSISSLGDDADADSEEEVTEYDGDYDTDIASSAKHKDALKAHNRDSSVDDEGALTDEARQLPPSPPARIVPPLPPTSPPRNVPPPLPPISAPKGRSSNEAPRAAPPPIPSAPVAAEDEDEDKVEEEEEEEEAEEEYDPYRYTAPQYGLGSPPLAQTRVPPVPSAPARGVNEEDDMYGAPSHPPPPMPAPQQAPPIPVERMAPPPPPPPSGSIAPPPPAHSTLPMMAGGLGPTLTPAAAPKPSVGVARQTSVSRRSTDQTRPSADYGFMASDIDLSEASLWWTQENTPPPSVASRTDILYEVESNTATKRGGKTTVNRDVYILFMDYSQTTINASFDPNDPTSASITQSHQRPPPPPRQDQLESVSHSFGNKIATAASQASGTTVADGSAQGFVWTLLQPLRTNALMPVGNRSFGASVYANLANASTQQFDEIRPGDIVTFRNAKFSGHKGGLHQKYSTEAGQPGRDHVAVVIDWDGTKKKIRAWEQGREEKKGSKGKVREESYRVGDLKSGEVRVWRVMGRSWVGWDSS